MAALTLSSAELEARLNGFTREFLRDKSAETVGTYRRSLNQFKRYVDESSEAFRFREEDVVRFREYLTEERGLSEVSVSTYLTALRRFCEYLLQIGLLEKNPARLVRGNPRPAEHSKRPLTPDEVPRLLATLDDETVHERRDRAIVYLMLYGGLSEIEISRANVEDLDHTLLGWVLHVQGKGRVAKDDQVPLDDAVVEVVKHYLAMRKGVRPQHPLLVSHGHRSEDRRLNTRSLRNRVDALLRAAGLKDTDVTPHSLTHTAPLLWQRDGLSLEEVHRRMRNATLDTTQLYLSKWS